MLEQRGFSKIKEIIPKRQAFGMQQNVWILSQNSRKDTFFASSKYGKEKKLTFLCICHPINCVIYWKILHFRGKDYSKKILKKITRISSDSVVCIVYMHIHVHTPHPTLSPAHTTYTDILLLSEVYFRDF